MWKIKATKEFEKWFNKLDEVQAREITKQMMTLREIGNRIGLPHSKSLGAGLFELRDAHFGNRVYYMFKKNSLILLLCGGDKGSQENDIKKARKLLQREC